MILAVLAAAASATAPAENGRLTGYTQDGV